MTGQAGELPDGAPGTTVEAVLARASDDEVRGLLESSAAALVDAVFGGEVDGARLRAIAAGSADFGRVFGEPLARDRFLRLLPPEKAGELARRVGTETNADPIDALNHLTWTPARRRQLFEFFGLTEERVPEEPKATREGVEPGYGLFDHQRRAAARAIPFLYEVPRRVVLHLPTGVGKTRVAMHVVSRHLREHGPTVVTWLAHGRELLEQAATEFAQAWTALGDREVDLVRVWGEHEADLAHVDDGMVIAGLGKTHAAHQRDAAFLFRLADRTTLTVFDEAHQSIAPTYRSILDRLTLRPDAGLLGLTATPGRTWADISADEELADYYGRQKVSLEVEGYDNPVTGLIEQGFLARPTFRTVAANAGLELTAADRKQLAEEFDLPDHVVRRLAESEQWNLQVVSVTAELLARHRRVLVFAAGVEHARVIAAVLLAMGHDAAYVTGETPTRERDRMVKRFKGGGARPMALCNYGVLTAGFDAPGASAAVIARPTTSLVLYSQMVGRVIRGPRANGTETCEIVTVVDPSLPGFGDVAQAFENWEDVW